MHTCVSLCGSCSPQCGVSPHTLVTIHSTRLASVHMPPRHARLSLITHSSHSLITHSSQVARSVAGSHLAKAAIFGHDPNWGRLAAAAGYSGVNFDQVRGY